MIWHAEGERYRLSDWTSGIYQCCPFHCDGTELPSGVTHAWNCPFWDTTDETPF